MLGKHGPRAVLRRPFGGAFAAYYKMGGAPDGHGAGVVALQAGRRLTVAFEQELSMSLTNRRWQQALAAGLAVASVYSVAAVAQEASSSGEVRRVDAAAGKVAIKHGAISDLDLPAMTLVYHVDPSLLKGIKPGDKVSFTAKRDGGNYVVTEIKK
jgi:Cu/Ag efflux protein CusF